MREILFRGKQLDNGEWVYGSLIDGIYGAVPVIVTLPNVDDDFKLDFEYDHVDPATLGQYTGLKDKNGRRIFEGDILRRAYHPNEDMIVEWYDGRFVFHRRIYPKDYGCESLVCCQQNVDRLAIIGNITDNPELLEK